MTTIAQARDALAAVLSALDGVDVRPRPTVPQPKTGDGWVIVRRVVPASFRESAATLTAVIVLGADSTRAEEQLDTLAVAVVDAVTGGGMFAADVAVEPEQLVVGQSSTPLYALTVTVTVPVGA